MKNYFDWLFEDTWLQTNPIFSWKKELREPQFEQLFMGNEPKIIHVQSSGWLAENKIACLRQSRFKSSIIDIATVMIYPTANPDLLPVFAAEWVAIQDRIHIIVLDTELLTGISNFPMQSFQDLKETWSAKFPNNENKPDWFKEIESPWSVFSSASVDKIHELRTMFNQYLTLTCTDCFLANKDYCMSGNDHKVVADYKIHHAINSPARRIIQPEFSEWLEEFLTLNHFGIIH